MMMSFCIKYSLCVCIHIVVLVVVVVVVVVILQSGTKNDRHESKLMIIFGVQKFSLSVVVLIGENPIELARIIWRKIKNQHHVDSNLSDTQRYLHSHSHTHKTHTKINLIQWHMFAGHLH